MDHTFKEAYEGGITSVCVTPGSANVMGGQCIAIKNLEVSKILGKSKSTAIRVMKKLKEMDVIVQVNGKGRGKYRFKYESEIKNKK